MTEKNNKKEYTPKHAKTETYFEKFFNLYKEMEKQGDSYLFQRIGLDDAVQQSKHILSYGISNDRLIHYLNNGFTYEELNQFILERAEMIKEAEAQKGTEND